MKKWILLLPIVLILGCAPNETIVSVPQEPEINIEEIKEQLKEEIKEEVKEEIKAEEQAKEEITIDNYDYKTDPDTVVVNINNNNIDKYFDLRIVYIPKRETYSVRTHSLMYDKGYVVVGYENCSFNIRSAGFEMEGNIEYMADDPGNCIRWLSPFDAEVAHGFTTEENAKVFLKDIYEYDPSFESENATIYYQKIEDLKFGNEITNDNLRIINGEEIIMNPYNPY